MAPISQKTFSNAFSSMKIYEFNLRYHWNLFQSFELILFQHWFILWLGAVQATSHHLNQWWLVFWRIYASLVLSELTHWRYSSLALSQRYGFLDFRMLQIIYLLSPVFEYEYDNTTSWLYAFMIMYVYVYYLQTVTSSSPMHKWRTSRLSFATMASANFAVTRVRRSCRNRVCATSSTDLSPHSMPFGRLKTL